MSNIPGINQGATLTFTQYIAPRDIPLYENIFCDGGSHNGTLSL